MGRSPAGSSSRTSSARIPATASPAPGLRQEGIARQFPFAWAARPDLGKATAKGQDAFATGNVIGTNRELLLVLAVSPAARVAASKRSMKISASMAVPSNAFTGCRFAAQAVQKRRASIENEGIVREMFGGQLFRVRHHCERVDLNRLRGSNTGLRCV